MECQQGVNSDARALAEQSLVFANIMANTQYCRSWPRSMQRDKENEVSSHRVHHDGLCYLSSLRSKPTDTVHQQVWQDFCDKLLLYSLLCRQEAAERCDPQQARRIY